MEKYNLSDNIKKLPAYNNAHELGIIVWEEVVKWNNFDKWSLGVQLVRAIDSVALNIAEGYGRYFYKEKIRFYYYARGSLLESLSCLRKAYNRKLISLEKCLEIKKLIDQTEKNISYLIYQARQNVDKDIV